MSLSLSVCYIVKNEEANIALSLESIKDISSEIIVIDTGSTDNTKIICQQFGAKVYDFYWSDDFAQARNYSIKFATQEWIMVFDADFILESNQEILKKYLNTNNSLYYVRCLEDKTGIEHPLIFLFRNNLNLHFSGKIHEQLVFDKNKFKPNYSEILIRHTGYNNPEIFAKKIERNNHLIELSLKENDLSLKEKLRLSAYLLKNRIYSYVINDFKGSESSEYENLINDILLFNDEIIKYPSDIIVYSQLFESYFLEVLKLFSQNDELFTKTLKTSLDIFPISINLLYFLADYYLNKGEYLKNIEILEFIAYLINSNNSSIYLFTINKQIKSSDYIYKNLIDSYYLIGNYQACNYYLEKIKNKTLLEETKKIIFNHSDLSGNLEKEIINNPSSYIYYRLTREYLFIQNKNELINEYSQKALELLQQNQLNINNDLYILINSALIENNFQDNISENFLENPYYCFSVAQHFFNNQEFIQALKHFESSLKIEKERHIFSNKEANLLFSESRFKSYLVTFIFKQIKIILSIISQSKL